MFPPGLEPGTFRVLGERDNHYTTETLLCCHNYFYLNKMNKIRNSQVVSVVCFPSTGTTGKNIMGVTIDGSLKVCDVFIDIG